MRRIWERTARIDTERSIPKAASESKFVDAEFKLRDNENSRDALIGLYTLQALAGRLSDAQALVERWVTKEPLSSEALTARADLAARNGDRELAIRVLGSVLDMRPDDIKAQMRLARLYRWAGQRDRGCRFSLAMAQLRPGDAERGAEAVRCLRQTDGAGLADAIVSAADEKTRKKIEKLLSGPTPDESKLTGDFRLEAEWLAGGDHDLDLALITPDGHRVSWLGAPTRAVISARDVLSDEREGLALRGAKPGEYVVEVVRASGDGPVRGKLTITVSGKQHRVPFLLDDDRTTVAIADVRMVSRLVPAR
jgi:tetratricopeptide (TPR) repeat protein